MVILINACIYKGLSSQQDIIFLFHFFDLQMNKYAQKRIDNLSANISKLGKQFVNGRSDLKTSCCMWQLLV